jgi:excisionase family DNA binding protein
METITFEQLPQAFIQLLGKVENIERLLQEKTSPQNLVDQLLTIQQAAQFLKLSVPTLYGLVSRSVVPVSKKGKRLYFSQQELTQWIREGRKKTSKELQLEAANFSANKKR